MITNLSIGHYGRLGNQIFQYALLKAVSFKKGFEVALPLENSQEYIQSCNYNPVIRKNDLYKLDLCDCFDIKDKILPRNEILKNIHYSFEEKKFGYNEDVFDIKDGTNFHGYFQSALFFYEYEKEIRQSLKFKSNIEALASDCISNLKAHKNAKKITAVHIRRGDAILQNGLYQVFLTEEYYNKVFKLLREQNNIFLVISDDLNWCKKKFQSEDIFFSDSKAISEISSIEEHFLDLCLISKSDQIVMSNSTFSWWGAWLSDSAIVYSPDKWWGPVYEHYGEEGLRYKNWQIINIQKDIKSE